MAANAEIRRVGSTIRAADAGILDQLRQDRRSQRWKAGEVAEVRCDPARISGFRGCQPGGQTGPAPGSLRSVHGKPKAPGGVGTDARRAEASCGEMLNNPRSPNASAPRQMIPHKTTSL